MTTYYKLENGRKVEMTPSEAAQLETDMANRLGYVEEFMRTQRNAILAESDWMASSDRTMTQAEMDYRQALRDITTHANWPELNDEDWPTKPE
jgi:hypothetical protein